MGDKRKRGRTQRKHFRQSRENVWKHDTPRPAGDGGSAGGEAGGDANAKWQPFATHNAAFEEYYKAQKIVPEDEWEDFISCLRKPLPAAFRINATGQFFQDICSQLENNFAKALETEVNDDVEVQGIRPLPWYPGHAAWHLNFSRMQLRKNQSLERFHEFLKQENEVGNITRQEAVSMVPPLFLDVSPEHHILDMCAAPGSKTFQLLEIMHQSITPGLLPAGLVIANDLDVQRCNLLIHQTKRMCTANLVVTNHEAQHFPSCYLPKGSSGSNRNSAINTLQFDRILCDVPCSGDGTLRKAPDIWRKWNAGMGNGLHRLQVDIAMRGITLLKVGGRMVYSTCSMNPIENEAVVAEILRRSGGSIKLLDVSGELTELVRHPGLTTWKVRDKGAWLASYKHVPQYRRGGILPSMFPAGERPTVEVNGGDIPNEVNNEPSEDNGEAASEIGETDADCTKTEISGFPLHHCMRIAPHDQNTGAFFIAVFEKLSPLNENNSSERSVVTNKDKQEPIPSSSLADNENLIEVNIESRDDVQQDTSPNTEDGCSEAKMEEDELNVKEGNGQFEKGKSNRKLQMQGKWKGVDPVVFFRDEALIASIRSFYGIAESFPLKGHLVTRNNDVNHVKRIYYVSKSAYEILELNFHAGHRLKIASVGLKTFERQSMKDGSLCPFRLSSEGLPLLLPYIQKQILYSSLTDFQHLLKYRTIKFPDFVDAKFGEEAAALLPGCCVVVLREGEQNGDPFVVDASTIAIICWKGKTNLCVLVSPLDGKELLERIEFRFGCGGTVQGEAEGSGVELVSSVNPVEFEAVEEEDAVTEVEGSGVEVDGSTDAGDFEAAEDTETATDEHLEGI